MKQDKRLPITLFNIVSSTKNLTLDKIISKARSKSKLNDLDEDFNEEGAQILINSINEEARLNAFGSFMISEKLTGQIESILWTHHWYKKYPEINEQELIPVKWIAGLQRTGTTKLQRLLSSVPDARALMSWEALYPAPIGQPSERKKRIKKTRLNEKAVRWISPQFYNIHPIHFDRPEEDVLLLDLSFGSTSYEAIMHVPTYTEWLDSQDHHQFYQYEKRILKLLQWQSSAKYWVLKSPHHLEHLSTINEVFHDSEFIWPHRSPNTTIPSYFSMLFHSRAMFSDDVRKSEIRHTWLARIQKMLDAGMDARKAIEIKDLFFEQIVHQEKETIESITGQPFFPQKVSKTYQSKHQYDLTDFDLSESELQTKFEAYYQWLNQNK